MLRSGSTWSFNVVLKLLRVGDPGRRTFGIFNESPAVLAAAARPRFSNLVIKSHVLDPSTYPFCCNGALKTIYTWRNPYDVVVSCERMFGLSVESWIPPLQNALRTWTFHRSTNSACIVAYESIVAEPSAVVERIADYLGLRIDPPRMHEIADEFSFERVKNFSRHVDQLESSRLERKDGRLFDRETLLHQGHIRNGGTGYGARKLNEKQLSAIDAVLREEGYEFLCEPRREDAEAPQPLQSLAQGTGAPTASQLKNTAVGTRPPIA